MSRSGPPHSPTPPGTATPGGVRVTLDHVRVERGRDTVLRVDSLAMGPGSTALVGPNGSGKSTLLHVVAGLLPPADGTVTFDGADPDDGRRVAYVLQSQPGSEHLLVTAREVVALAASSRRLLGRLRTDERAAVDEVMERLEVADLASRHLAEMSGGQRQRVLIAQGLAQRAPVLLLDEPVAGLDLASERTIRRAIDDERAAGRTVIVATHDLHEAQRADRVVLLASHVVAHGLPAEVLRSENLREAYRGHVLELDDGSIAVDDDHHR
ncbi:metal ABC transporter ATP-binding protein [Ilumatobacter sp.]|uniref:metal ABC transporter ATP-binding protein n=1 Tax=Ilumatobacter sp. TaxID=1967498 RepID=UPI003B51B586